MAKKNNFILLMFLLMLSSGVYAGALSEFEAAAKSPEKERKESNGSGHDHHHSDDDGGNLFSELMFDIITLPFKLGGYMSLARVDMPRMLSPEDETFVSSRDGEFFVSKRLHGELLIPFARTDLYSHIGDRGVYSANSRVEIGYGPLGFEVRYSDLREQGSQDRLRYSVFNILYRMSFGSKVEIDLGLGTMDFYGRSHSGGVSLTTPIMYQHSHSMGVEWRPTWLGGDSISFRDHLLALHYGRRYYSALLGYRWLNSAGVSLAGPVVGLTASW